jgi:hypothetical protein
MEKGNKREVEEGEREDREREKRKKERERRCVRKLCTPALSQQLYR